ncbi:hypothetical protein GCM10009761_25770 [Agromyces terreus]
MRMRAAPTESGSASGRGACAVPVVPKHTDARSTATTKRMHRLFHNLAERAPDRLAADARAPEAVAVGVAGTRPTGR